MSSPFFSELSKLDDNLRIIQSQVDRVRAGLDFDEASLKQGVLEARQHVALLRDLIRAENPEAKWSDRDALEHLILALEIAFDEKRKEQRRAKLVGLASELEAGRVKHRVSARATALNALRLTAVEQLKGEAGHPEQEKELPGPEAREWVHWVCGLQEDKDAALLAQLRTDFPALAEFTVEMEETFWVPAAGTQAAQIPAPEAPVAVAKPEEPVASKVVEPVVSKPVEAAAPKAEAPAAAKPATTTAAGPTVPVRVKAGQLPPHIRAEFDKALHTGDFSDALLLCYDMPASESPAAENASPVEASAASQPGAVVVSGAPIAASEAAPPPLRFCTECGRTYPHRYNVCPFDSSALSDLPDSVPEPVSATSPLFFDDDVAPNAMEKPVEGAATPVLSEVAAASSAPMSSPPEPESTPHAEGGAPEPLPTFASESSPSFGELTLSKRPVATWVAAAILVVLVAVFIWMHYFQGLSSKAGSSVANAATNQDPAAASNNGSDPGGAKTLLHRDASEGPQDNILLSMENCERTTSAGIECWGYISNQRNKDSKVSLYRADVIDGKGNSFDLSSKGQTTFTDVHDFNVPAQSKVKYSVKVPDNDRDARTLTLYLDVYNPRLSEYTFRDVPVSD